MEPVVISSQLSTLFHSGSVSMAASPPDGSGVTRRQSVLIQFDPPFRSLEYKVSVTPVMVDVAGGTLRLQSVVEKLSEGEMVIHMETWADTNLVAARFDFLAIGR